jgi:hypothetical protein
MNKTHNSLRCVVRYVNGKGKFKVATEADILVGPIVVARRTMGGRWSQSDVLTDFRRNPFLFKKDDNGWPVAKTLKLVA